VEGPFFPHPRHPHVEIFSVGRSLQVQTTVQTNMANRKKNKAIDWKRVEADFRAGIMSIREIARFYEISDTAVHKKAKVEGWERKPKAPGPFEEYRSQRSAPIQGEILPPPSVKPEALTDRGRVLTGRLLDELEAVTTHAGELEDLICQEEGDPRRRQALLKAISLPERAKTLKDIALTMKTLNEAGVPEGKKAEKQRQAEEASNKFGVRGPPRLVADNTK
jgi:hypothetical protein